MKNQNSPRSSPYFKKQQDYNKERISTPEYPHLHRRNYPRAKKRFKRMERRVTQGLLDLALIRDETEEVSNALLQTIAVRLKGPKQGAVTLRELVEWKLERRAENYGAKKRRQELPYTPRSAPKNDTKNKRLPNESNAR